MPVPVVVSDFGGPYQLGQLVQTATIVFGSPTVFVKGQPVATLPGAITSLGPIVSSTLNTTKVLVKGSPVILGGSVTNCATGWSNGTVLALNAIGVLMS